MKKAVILILLLVFGLSVFPLRAWGLSVSPPKMEFAADPGDTISGRLFLRNTEGRKTTYYPSFERVEVKGSWGEPVFTTERTGLASWITVGAGSVTLAPDEPTEVSFTIKVPSDAQPGGHYAAIFWGTAPPKDGAGIGIISRVAILVLLNVSGDVVEQAAVSDFNTDKKILSHLPVAFNYVVKNTGTVYLKPQGEVVVKNIFGQESAVILGNPEKTNVLPGSLRKFVTIWQKQELPAEEEKQGFWANLLQEKNNFGFGYYRAFLSLEVGKEKQVLQAKTSFFVLPWRLLIVSLLALAVLVFLLIICFKRYNRWIIKRARS